MTVKNIRTDPVPNNPAGRLLAVFERMRATRGPTPEFRPKSAAEGWAFVLETDVADLPALFKGIANLASLVNAMSIAVNKIGGGVQPTNLTAWIPSFFRPWQSFNLTTTFDHFSSPVDETMMSILRISNDLLSHQHPEPTVQMEQLKKLHQDVVQLAEEISTADLDPSLRTYLLYLLEIIENAISDYRIKGFSSLREGLEQSVGAFVICNRSVHEEFKENPSCKKVLNALGIYALIITSVLATVQLPHEIQKYLPNHREPGSSASGIVGPAEQKK